MRAFGAVGQSSNHRGVLYDGSAAVDAKELLFLASVAYFDSLWEASRKIVESFFLLSFLGLRRGKQHYSRQTGQNQSERAFVGVLGLGLFQNMVPRETQTPLWGGLMALSGEMPENDCGCR